MTNWEFYPVYIVNIPTVLIWLYFGLRARALFFFSTVNPVIETGGVMGESKINILSRIPEQHIPRTLFVKSDQINLAALQQRMQEKGIIYPIVAKPDVGERGFLVEKIEDAAHLEQYLKKMKVDFIIQEFINLPLELSVLYYRMPDSKEGKITSLCIKKVLSVKGDGVSRIETLMERYPRARFQLNRFRNVYPELLKTIPEAEKVVVLEPIGNHSRGTTFLNGNKHICSQMTKVFDQIATRMDGVHYGRFDLKCQDITSLKKGCLFKILEFNGIASEPAHIYDPEYSVLRAYHDIYQHWKIIFRIGKIQLKNGVLPMTWREAYGSVKAYFKYLKFAKATSS